MHKQKLPKELKAAVSAYVEKHDAQREATNAVNRQKTVLRNTVRDEWARESYPIGSFIRSNGLDIKYEATETPKIDPERVMELYENEEITREQFLRMINIDKAQAKNIIGGDQVAEFEVIVTGKNADIRIEKTPIEAIDEEFIGVTEKVKPRRRRIIGGKPKVTEDSKPNRRRIKVRSKK